MVFGSTKVFSGFAVPDLAAARDFYGDTLGMDVDESDGLLTIHVAGGHDIVVYPKPDHAPANFTILNFPVDDIDSVVDELTSRGVQFQRYEDFDQDEKGIARDERGPAIAWFTDPAGNILSVIQAH